MAKSLRVEVIGDASRYSRSLREAEGSTSRFGAGVKKLGVVVAAASAAVGVAAVEIGKKSVEAAINAQEANDKLTQAFKNQKRALDAQSPVVLKLEAASRQLGFANSDTREGLLKLTNAGRNWAQTSSQLAAAQDLARVSGKSLGDSVTDLIRLQAGNLRAAKQYAIVLPDLTKKQWEAKAAADGLTIAQEKGKFAYDQLTGKIQGQAQVFSDSAAGGIAKYHAALQNLEETLGAKLLPAVAAATQAIDNFLNFLTGAGSATDKFNTALTTMGLSSEQAAAVTAKLSGAFESIKATVEAVVPALTSLWATWGDTIQAVTGVVMTYLVDTIRNAFQVIKGIFEVFHGLLTGDWTELWQGLKDIFGGIAAQIMTTLRAWASGVEIVFSTLWHGITALTLAAVGAAVGAATAFGAGIKNGVVTGLSGLASLVEKALSAVYDVIQSVGRLAYQFALGVGHNMVLGVWAGIESLGGWLKNKILGFFLDIWNSVLGIFGIRSPSKLWADTVGRPMAEGVGVGFRAAIGPVGAGIRRSMLGIAADSGGAISGSFSGGGGGGSITVHAPVYLDGKLIADNTYTHLLRKNARNATLGFT